MSVSGISSSSSGMSASQITSELSVAIFKQQQEQQQRMAEAIVEMIKQTPTPSLEGTGKIVDILA